MSLEATFHEYVWLPFSLQDWIFKQICHSAPPLHSLFPPLLEAYVSSVVVSTQQFRIEPLTEREILSVYQTSNVSLLRASVCQEGGLRTEGKSGLTAQLLMLYYLLLYEDCVLSNMKILGKYALLTGLNGQAYPCFQCHFYPSLKAQACPGLRYS